MAKVLGIDFGTSNTYLTVCPGGKDLPKAVDFQSNGKQDGVETVILYRKNAKTVIGKIASEEFGDADEKSDLEIHMQFKPDIAYSKQAQKFSIDFFKEMFEVLRLKNLDLNPLVMDVIIGMPSRASDDFKKSLIKIADKAKLGNVKVVHEPIGAIFSHLHRNEITLLDSIKGTLVVDFGGGTCDFAILYNQEIKHSWGDMFLGGRIFDDVFFQWFVDQNPIKAKEMHNEGDAFYVLWHCCKEIKEKFSNRLVEDPECNLTFRVSNYGKIKNVTATEFTSRASNYKPSKTFMHYIESVNPKLADKLNSESTRDLFQWFRALFLKGLRETNSNAKTINTIILTGGSSSWFFVSKIIKEEMEKFIKQEFQLFSSEDILKKMPKIIRSLQPYSTISEGLSLIPAYKRRLDRFQDKMTHEITPFISKKVSPVIDKIFEKISSQVSSEVESVVFDKKIKPVVIDFRDKGGSISSLKEAISNQAKESQNLIREVLNKSLKANIPFLSRNLSETVEKWLEEHKISLGAIDNENIPIDYEDSTNFDILDEVMTNLERVTQGIVGVVIANVCGGAGIALVAHGPFALITSGIVAFILAGYLFKFGQKKAKEEIEKIDIAPKFLKWILTDKKIKKISIDFKKQVKESVSSELFKVKSSMISTIRDIINNEIKAIKIVKSNL